jgi:hypothetical protein
MLVGAFAGDRALLRIAATIQTAGISAEAAPPITPREHQ